MRLAAIVPALFCAACGADDPAPAPTPPAEDAVEPGFVVDVQPEVENIAPDIPDTAHPVDIPIEPIEPDVVDVSAPMDDAAAGSTSHAPELECGEAVEIAVGMKNIGETTWAGDAYRLVPLGDSKMFYDKSRVKLPKGTSVAPGETHSFEFSITAPKVEGDYVLKWRMRSEAGLFGEVTKLPITVGCPDEPEIFPPPIAEDFSNVMWIHPDISDWPQPVTLTATKGPADTINIANNGTTCGASDACWPTFNPSYVAAGEPLYNKFVGGVWIFVYQDGVWLAGLFDSILRDQQVVWDHNLIPGSGWPGGALNDFLPQSGKRYGWMISTALPVLSTQFTVNERSNVSEFVWP